ncbi:TNF receptor-associated factor 2-like [Branchiostoma floridae x Branchiostoma japonicum]
MPGYPLEIFEARVENKYLCSVCRLVLREPFQTYCGHRYCKSCLDEIFRMPGIQMCKQCPQDAQSEDSMLRSDQAFPDRAIRRDIGEIPVKCLNAEACEWKGKAHQYDEHQEICEFGLISCPKQGCGKQVMRLDLAAHLEKECAVRQVKCKYCAQKILLKDEKDHLFICPQVPVNCDFCGKKKIPRAQLQQHQDENTGDCKRLKVACPFASVECPAKLEREKLNDHIVNHQVDHLSLMRDKYLTLMHQYDGDASNSAGTPTPRANGSVEDFHTTVSGQVMGPLRQEGASSQPSAQKAGVSRPAAKVAKMPNDGITPRMKECIDKLNGVIAAASQRRAGPDSEVVKSLENRLQQIASKHEEMRHKYVAMESRVATFEGIVAVLNREIEKCSATIEAYERQRRQDREIIESIERKMKSQERIIALKDVAFAEQDLRITSLEMTSYDATLLWKIQDFTRKRHDAITGKTTSIYSPCFYTSRTGYKMCARIYLNGDGMGKGSHISLFFVLMRGHFDGLLRWPFRQKVTFMLLDQNNREHVLDAFRPDPTSSSFKRPTSDMNIASGCPLFVPLSQLESTRHAYVRDDAIFLKIIVDTSDIN